MKRDELGQELSRLLKKSQGGEIQSLAKLISAVEKDVITAASFLSKLKSKSKTLRLGITGPPGAGKSTLISELVKNLRRRKLKVAVVAVDPSSPFSGGAILGDRIRMSDHGEDKGVFIRSVGSRGGWGGLSAATGALAAVLEAVGFDVVIIETVGVGQTELQIMNLADLTTVVLVPESGDVVQTLKAGILEIADVFVVNKKDRPGAEMLSRELQSLVELEGAAARPLFLTTAITGEGVDPLVEKMLSLGEKLKTKRRSSQDRLRGQVKSMVIKMIQEKLDEKLQGQIIKNVYEAFLKFKW